MLNRSHAPSSRSHTPSSRSHRGAAFGVGLTALSLAACDQTPTLPETAADPPQVVLPPSFARVDVGVPSRPPNGVTFADFSEIDRELAAAGLDVRLGVVEYLTLAESDEQGLTVFTFNRGNKQLVFDWVSGDPRRGGGTNITYMVDEGEGAATGGLTNGETEPAIDRAMGTWNSVQCSGADLSVDKLPWNGIDLGVVQLILGFGGTTVVFVDLSHAGWLPKAFFSAPPFFPPDGGDFILAATFTFGFIDGSGNFTDINGDRKLDAALREIYYNNNFPWGIDTGFPIDVETVVLHESGHGLSQAHFGFIFVTDANGTLHFAPRAVMNAAYSGVQQAPTGTDSGGHCSIWGNWPNN
ncbi:MAG: hypothetical protein ACE5JR_12940 [Gemmatimonadota bacterium]